MIKIFIRQDDETIEIPEDALINNYILGFAENDWRYYFKFDKKKLSTQVKKILLSYKAFILNVKGQNREDLFTIESNKYSDLEAFMIRRHVSPYQLIYENDKEISVIINNDH